MQQEHQQQSDGEAGEQDGEQEEARAAAEAAALREQLQGISRSIWGTLSAGAASGACTYQTSRSRTDFSYSEAAVQAMRTAGELDSTHHRRRDAHAAYVEACARDALIRRGGAVPAREDK